MKEAMDRQKIRIVYKRLIAVCSYVLIFLWMAFIFYMSAQPGDLSGEISGSVSHLFMKVWNGIFRLGWDELEILHMAEVWDYPIRKLAHMTEFGILAILIYWGLGQKFLGRVRELLHIWFPAHTRYVVAWFFTVIYAATDEIHQLFVPGRSGNAFDVCVDATGALLALLVVWGTVHIIEICKRRRNRNFTTKILL